MPAYPSLQPADRSAVLGRYGCRHRLRLAPFIQQDSAHAGHTGAGNPGCKRALSRLFPAATAHLRPEKPRGPRARLPEYRPGDKYAALGNPRPSREAGGISLDFRHALTRKLHVRKDFWDVRIVVPMPVPTPSRARIQHLPISSDHLPCSHQCRKRTSSVFSQSWAVADST
jgi:hypothetical protein